MALSWLSLLSLLSAGLTAAAASSHGSVVSLTDKNFDEVVGDGKVHFVKFFAPWCGHCKHLAPIWKELADSYSDNASVAISHVDCTKDTSVCSKADIKGYPTLKVFYNGEEQARYQGGRDLATLKAYVDHQIRLLATGEL